MAARVDHVPLDHDVRIGEDAVALGRKTGFDYALFMYAEDSFASTGRVALQVLGVAGCIVGFCAPNIGGGGQFAYASLVDLHTGDVVWFNVVSAQSQVAGIKFGDMRTEPGAEQLVDRLLGEPGTAAAQWAAVAQGVDPRLTADPYWPTLAERLSTAERAGIDVSSLVRAAGDRPLPDEQPAAALWWRLPASMAAPTSKVACDIPM